jgi:hypothetical protein
MLLFEWSKLRPGVRGIYYEDHYLNRSRARNGGVGSQISSCLYHLGCHSGIIHVSAAGDDHVESVRLCDCEASGFRRFHSEFKIAKNQNTFAKRQREQEKRQRADEKRKKRDQKKDGSFSPAPSRSYAFPSEDREE